MEAIEEITSNADLCHEWRKVYRTAIKGPAARTSGCIRSKEMYEKRPLPRNWPQFSKLIFAGSMEVMDAWSMRTSLESVAAGYIRATMLPQATLEIEAHTYPEITQRSRRVSIELSPIACLLRI